MFLLTWEASLSSALGVIRLYAKPLISHYVISRQLCKCMYPVEQKELREIFTGNQ